MNANSTSGYEEAAAQGLVAGLSAARRSLGLAAYSFGRDCGYLGVMLDDLVAGVYAGLATWLACRFIPVERLLHGLGL